MQCIPENGGIDTSIQRIRKSTKTDLPTCMYEYVCTNLQNPDRPATPTVTFTAFNFGDEPTTPVIEMALYVQTDLDTEPAKYATPGTKAVWNDAALPGLELTSSRNGENILTGTTPICVKYGNYVPVHKAGAS